MSERVLIIDDEEHSPDDPPYFGTLSGMTVTFQVAANWFLKAWTVMS
jgi:hypothetical protein